MNKRLVLLACFLTVFVAYAVRYGYGVLLPDMLNSLGITKTDAGIIFSSFFIAYTVGSPICGFISDRYGSRWLLGSFITTLGIGAFLMSYSNSILQASLFFTLAGLGSAACWAPVMALAQKWTSHERRGMTLSFIDIGSALSIIAMGVFIPVIVRHYDWRTGWMILGGMTIAVGLFNFLAVRNPPEAIQPEPGKTQPKIKPAGIPLALLMRSSKFWMFGAAYFFAGVAYAVPFTFLSTYAVQEIHLSYVAASNIMTFLGIGAIISKLTIGPISDKTGRIKMLLLCSGLICLGIFSMMLRNHLTIYIAAFIFSLGYGAIWALYAAASSDYFARESSGTIVGIWTLFLGLGSTLAPIISGRLADATGTLSWSFGMGAAGGLVSILFLVLLWKRQRAERVTSC
jgi:MFS family permease